MKKTINFTWMAMDAKTEVTANITIERSVIDKVAYADGYNVNIGKETYRNIDIRIIINGKQMERSSWLPQISTHPKVLETGRYALIGKVAIMKNTYEDMMRAIENEIELLESDEEYRQQKAIEDEREAKQRQKDIEDAKNYAKQRKNGLCGKCGTYCYGDCEAN
jgi:hypothetical protein